MQAQVDLQVTCSRPCLIAAVNTNVKASLYVVFVAVSALATGERLTLDVPYSGHSHRFQSAKERCI